MRTLFVRNVCQALPMGLNLLLEEGIIEQSRNGPVVALPWPVTTVTSNPRERVLFSAVRDANPTFHIFESIWMLAGENNAFLLDTFVKDFSARYAENGILHGAYGYRWRNHFGFDQLDFCIEKLSKTPDSRQCVIQMWDCMERLMAEDWGADDLRCDNKDRPCNTHIYLRIVNGKLNMLVSCRSNDMLWGAHGANAVHFSVLQEYLAARLAIPIGTMYQISFNYHIYLKEFDKLRNKVSDFSDLCEDPYMLGMIPLLMFDKPEYIDSDIRLFIYRFKQNEMGIFAGYKNLWFSDVLCPAVMAHWFFRHKENNKALFTAGQIQAADWRKACVEWLERRTISHAIKHQP